MVSNSVVLTAKNLSVLMVLASGCQIAEMAWCSLSRCQLARTHAWEAIMLWRSKHPRRRPLNRTNAQWMDCRRNVLRRRQFFGESLEERLLLASSPVLGNVESTELPYEENGAASVITSTITVSDVDSANMTQATIQIVDHYTSGEDVLSYEGALTQSFNAGTGTLTLSGSASVQVYQTELRKVKYRNSSDAPSDLDRGVQFRAWDGALWIAVGVKRIIDIIPVNDAPVLADAEYHVESILEDPVNNIGDLVSEIIASAGIDAISDVDSGAVEGLAVTFANSTGGSWQYLLSGDPADPGNWRDFGYPTNDNARLLSADTDNRIRFSPMEDFHGFISIHFRAWDQTSGTDGGTADTSINGKNTAFSSHADSARIFVLPVNDAPFAESGANGFMSTWLKTAPTKRQ